MERNGQLSFDSRRSLDVLRTEFPHVDFTFVTEKLKYEEKFGSHAEHTTLRESNDVSGLRDRAHSAWKMLLSRPERELALVGHSAFFVHMFTRSKHMLLPCLMSWRDW